MIRRILSLILSLLLCAGLLPWGCLAGNDKTMYVACAEVRVYPSPDLSGKVMKTVWFGEAVTVESLDREGDVARLTNASGQTGYCNTDGLTDENPNTRDTTVYAQLERTRIYAGCSAQTKTLAALKRNETVTMVAASPDGWIRVRTGGKYGYMRSWEVDDAPYVEGAPAWCVYDGTMSVLSRRQDGAEIGILRLGDAVALLDRVEGSAKIRNAKGCIGWTVGEYINEISPILNETVYAQVSDKILARQPGGQAGLKVNKKVGKGAKLMLVAQGGFWARVKYHGRTYFTPAILVAPEKPPQDGRVVVTLRACDMLDTPRIGGKEIASLPRGEILRLLTGGPLFAKVTTTGDAPQTGWVLISQLVAK